MKIKTFIILLSFLISFSCAEEESIMVKDFEAHSYPQTWKLYKMTGNLPDSETTGEDMAWQEEYRFSSDGTVVKTRKDDGESLSVTGRYELFQENDLKGIVIEYEEENEIIASCSGKVEDLFFKNEETELYGSWWACDGPGLFYKRQK
ncbi:hypothetical protein [Gramella sp. KN1008]|uniref:hypothetical protein n=1 Tax=Gramella sp. KN1008 TaxID=2529298 RepID=UPI00103E8437|nr:hypothetical protein [Gramella sp. KN1008]TBW29997.1 hypothetical protein EZJ28_00920 [Gramella sp. KN1008]